MLAVPLQFHSIPKVKVWGADRLRTIAHKPFPPGEKVGESWEISDHGRDVSVVASGALAGRSLRDLLKENAEALMGPLLAAQFGTCFPLLLKLLDTSAALSVQVHPSDEQARRMRLDDCGKTEAWYVLHAEPGAVMFHGLWEGTGRGDFERMVAEDSVERAIRCFPVRPGDAIFCPAGTVHAIGAGLSLFEIQQSSDTTFRVFDWHRPDDPANPRPLHIEQALEVIRFGEQPPPRCTPAVVAIEPFRRESLVCCEKFSIEQWRFERPARVRTPGRFELLSVVEGEGSIAAGGESVALRRGDSVLIPAAAPSWDVAPAGALTLLRVVVPDAP